MSSELSPIQKIPNDVLCYAFSYLDPEGEDLRAVPCVCRLFHSVLEEYRRVFLEVIQNQPYLQFLVKNSSRVQECRTYKAKMNAISEYFKLTNAIQKSIKGYATTSGLCASSLMNNLKQRRLRISSLEPGDAQRNFGELTTDVNFNGMFLSALLTKDWTLVKSFNTGLISEREINIAIYICTRKKWLDQLKNFTRENFPISPGMLADCLCVARASESFEHLLSLRKPFDANKVLVYLSSIDQVEKIQKLFGLEEAINEDYYSMNGWEHETSGTPGIHTALMEAMNRNCERAFCAILAARRNIDRRILEHLKNLAQNHLDGVQDPELTRYQVALRNQNPNLQNFITILNQEIAQRFPGEEPPALVEEEVVWPEEVPEVLGEQEDAPPQEELVQPELPVQAPVARQQVHPGQREILLGLGIVAIGALSQYFLNRE